MASSYECRDGGLSVAVGRIMFDLAEFAELLGFVSGFFLTSFRFLFLII